VRPARGEPWLDGAILEVANAQRTVGAQPGEDVRAELAVDVPPRADALDQRAVAPRPPAHLPSVQRQVLGEHERGLVREVLEQLAIAIREALEQGGIERPEAAEEHEQVRARDHARRVELQTPQRAAGVEDRGAVGPAPRPRPGEALGAQREPPDGGDGDAEHRRATIIRAVPRPALREVGEDPDPRFTFANERTFLAWNRTALALIGAGLAAGQLLDFDTELVRLFVALPPIVLGGVLAITSYRRWEANERAMRLREPLPVIGPPRFVPPAIAGLALLVAVLVVAGAIRA
jgi:inner membrane protein YidH